MTFETDCVEETPPAEPARRSYIPIVEPTPEDKVADRIMVGDPILRKKFQIWLEHPENDDSRVFVQRVLHEPGFEDSLPFNTPEESRPAASLVPQQENDFTPEPPTDTPEETVSATFIPDADASFTPEHTTTLTAGEETPLVITPLSPISGPTPAPTVTAVDRFIVSSQNGVDGVAVFAEIGGRTPAQPNSFAEASAPRALKPRPTLRERAIGLLPPGLRPSGSS